MAYSEYQRQRIEKILATSTKSYNGKNFMGGYCFFVNDKMCVGIDIDKKTGRDRLMARIGESAMQSALTKRGCRRMDVTGKPLKGFVFVDADGFGGIDELTYWIQLSINHNPFAQKSKKK